MALEGRQVLYISYNGMLEALGQSQVIPYLRELSRRGVRFTLLSFEREAAFKDAGPNSCSELFPLGSRKCQYFFLKFSDWIHGGSV